MTQHPLTFRERLAGATAALLLVVPAALVAAPAMASTLPSDSVYPRASVSSDAYRTPPQRLSSFAAQPLVVQHQGQVAGRQRMRDANLVQVDHQEPRTSAEATSVRSELQRLYADEGRDMPQMAMPARRPSPAAGGVTRTADNGANAPMAEQQPQRSSGLLAGLFDFGRSRTSRRSHSNISQPPAEPAPFQPPSYRHQQPRPLQAMQTTPQQIPQQRTAAPQVTTQPPAAQTAQSNSVIELKRIAPQGNAAPQGVEFFPEDAAELPAIVSEEGAATAKESSDDMAEFFPEDVTAPAQDVVTSPAVASAANTAKEKMQEMFREQSQAAQDDFQMPVATQEEEEIIPQPAPAAVSEVVTTTVTPMPADGLAEPAPFFADEERAINPDESMEVAALDGQTFDPSGADSRATAGSVSDAQDAGSRMQQIAAREGVGLKGYCAVALRDERRLADGKAAYVSYYQGKPYYFSSESAKVRFDASPSDYAPASGGEDLTMKTLTGEVVEGSLDHSVWYKGRLYLFHTADNLKTFMAAPSAMAIDE
jgi:YHS domain-containing protein